MSGLWSAIWFINLILFTSSFSEHTLWLNIVICVCIGGFDFVFVFTFVFSFVSTFSFNSRALGSYPRFSKVCSTLLVLLILRKVGERHGRTFDCGCG